MIEKIKSLSDYFNKENENPSSCINSDLFKKYSIYKNWLIENGAIFSKNIDFPYTYGPFNLIGCKSVSDLLCIFQENPAVTLIRICFQKPPSILLLHYGVDAGIDITPALISG